MSDAITIFADDEGRFCLTITDTDERTLARVEERGLQGGGYTWEAIALPGLPAVSLHKPYKRPRFAIR